MVPKGVLRRPAAAASQRTPRQFRASGLSEDVTKWHTKSYYPKQFVRTVLGIDAFKAIMDWHEQKGEGFMQYHEQWNTTFIYVPGVANQACMTFIYDHGRDFMLSDWQDV